MEAYNIAFSFINYNLAFLIIFAVITLAISLYSYRIYRLTKQNQLKIFSMAFLLFFLGYAAHMLIFFFVRVKPQKMLKGMGKGRGMVPWEQFFSLEGLAGNFHAILIILGFIMLTYMTLKAKNQSIMVLLSAVVVISLIVAGRQLFLFHLLAAIFALFILIYYFKHYLQHKQSSTFIVLLGFVFLFAGQVALIFSMQDPDYFMAGRISQLVAFLFFLTNLFLLRMKK